MDRSVYGTLSTNALAQKIFRNLVNHEKKCVNFYLRFREEYNISNFSISFGVT